MEHAECPYKGELSVTFRDAFDGFPEPFSAILRRFSLSSYSVFTVIPRIRLAVEAVRPVLKPAPNSSAGD